MMREPSASFVAAMRRAASSVTIVTTDGEAGRFGLTVSAMSSVSAEPPMLLVCLNTRSPAAAAVLGNGVFAVNLLAESQGELACAFAGRPLVGAPFDFATAEWAPGETGAPLLRRAAARFDCRVAQSHLAGTHRIIVGHVLSASSDGEAAPLVYGNRLFGRHAPFPPAAA